MKKMSEEKKKFAFGAIVSLLAFIILLLAISSVSSSIKLDDENIMEYNPSLMYGITWIVLALIQIPMYFRSDRKYKKIKIACCFIIFLIMGLLLCILCEKESMLLVSSICLYIVLLFGRVMSILDNHKVRNIISNVLLSIILLILLLASLITMPFDLITRLLIPALVIASTNFLIILDEAFSKIQLASLKDIIQKTYATEIIMGLVLLIVSFSFIFTIIEDISYGDALWFCFATVTTIGYGDVTVHSVISRIMAVLLGIYGTIVVAVITSIIVNFYNETKYIGKKEQEENKDDAS